MLSKKIIGLTLAAALPVLLGGTGQIPKIRKAPKIAIPGLDRLFKEDPPVKTSLSDALTELPFLDDYHPKSGLPLGSLRHDEDGLFSLIPGVYSLEAESYCIKAGTYSPSGGDGYLYAPLKGPKASIVRNLLRRSASHFEIAQQDIQVLLWAIIARAKLSEMSSAKRGTAAKLLTKEEMAQLEAGALGFLSDDVRDKALAKLSGPLRQVYEAENRLRGLLTRLDVPFEEMERVAVLAGAAPTSKDDRMVHVGRWSYHPQGYFVRYLPVHYSHTYQEVYVPEPFLIERDTEGRVTRVGDEYGNSIEARYEDGEGSGVPGDPGLKVYALKTVRFLHGKPGATAPWVLASWDSSEPALVGVPNGKGKPSAVAGAVRVDYDMAIEIKAQLDQLSENLRKLPDGKALGAPMLSDLVIIGEFRAAVARAAGRAAAGDSALADHLDRAANAWMSALAGTVRGIRPFDELARVPDKIASAEESGPAGYLGWTANASTAAPARPAWRAIPHDLFTDWPGASDGPASPRVSYDPSESVAVPGVTAKQRLVQSSRCADKYSNAYEDPAHASLAKAISDAIKARGAKDAPVWITPQKERAKNFTPFSVALGHHNNNPLPNLPCINQEIAKGNVPMGSLEGPLNLMFGAVQVADNQTRVTVRIVDLETGTVLSAGKGDAAGVGDQATRLAADRALADLGIQFE